MSARHSRQRRRDRGTGAAAGFTLIEVVLALVILSLIALMLYSAFETGHRAVIAGERKADVNQRTRLAEEILGRQIRSAVFYFARHDEDQVPYFVGRADGVSFVTSAPQGRGGTGLAVATYRVLDNQLVLEERGVFSPDDLYDPPSDAAVARAVLVPHVSSILFEYIARDDTEANWQRTWDAQEEDALPAAVRITMEGLPFFDDVPWTQVVPLMTIAYGWGADDFEQPPDEEDHEGDGDSVGDNDNNASPDEPADPEDLEDSGN